MNSKKRVLFVDDDLSVLNGLQRSLRSMKNEWEMEFASSGSQALHLMDSFPPDAVITDMRMPEVDGLQVLVQALENHPQAARVVLSGQAQSGAILRAVQTSHLILMKPCECDTIRDRVQRVLKLQERIKDEWLRALVAQVASVPSCRRLLVEALRELESKTARMERIVQLVSMDMGMCAAVLHFVNSGYFPTGAPVSSPERAIRLLGSDMLRELLVSNCTYSPANSNTLSHLDPGAVWCEGAATSVAARAIAVAHTQDSVMAEDAFTAGLLHDIGQVVLARILGSFYDSILARAAATGEQLWKVEREMFGSTHGEVGAYLLGLWGLPDAVVDAVAYHHDPSNSPVTGFSAVTAVHIANVIEHQKLNNGNRAASLADHAYLRSLGLDQQLESWTRVMTNGRA